ncbi:hypothetical protein KLP40_18865 [Hymenobacter sp. NST-14]|uniref:hypothetical protein n=1 Tax=Hymenobacter piscis TaxID=2839984 RepID=UPI001C0320C8|nr:hypothetical protein [Hymenobacter piscis]MBT9395238.1 hypothetical protein [Hymenobacter piscis]
MRIAAKTLRRAITQPERLSMASVYGLADLLKMSPEQLLADLFHQVSIRHDLGLLQTRHPDRPRRNRSTGRDDTTRPAG